MSSNDKQSKKTVRARLVKGFRDNLSGELLLRNRMIDTIRRVVERYGFSPLETPAVERLDVLLGKYGDEGSASLFRFETDDEEAVGLRFDLTVPLARVIAQHRDLPRPFRRYQVSPVWRMDKPGPGRFREFMQFDIDTVGTKTVAADVEILIAMIEVFTELGIADACQHRVSSRRLLDALVRFAGVPEDGGAAVFRVLDKLDKQGLEAVKLELGPGRVDKSGDPIPGLGLETSQIDRIEKFLAIGVGERGAILAAVGELLDGVEGASEALDELGAMHEQLTALGDESVVFDVSLARGLDYYTGPIFETILPEAPNFGTVFGGGRYDGLVERFLGEPMPGTGGSIGVDRLLAALLHLGVYQPRNSTTDVLVTVFDQGLMPEYQKLTAELRGAGVATELYLGTKKPLKKQLSYADKIGARVAVIMGEDERGRDEVSIKDLDEGAARTDDEKSRGEYLKARFGQQSVKRADMVDTIRGLLADS